MTTRRPTLAIAFALYAGTMAWITALVAVPLLAVLPSLEPGLTAADWTAVLLGLSLGAVAGPLLYGTVAVGLHRGSSWSGTAATVLALLSLGNLPFGMLLGMGTLYELHGNKPALTG